MELVLLDKEGNSLSNMSEDTKTLYDYGAEDGYTIHVIDLNPNSVLK